MFATHTRADSFNYRENATFIMRIAEEVVIYLYRGYKIELKNGLKFKTDLNASTIYAPNKKQLFDYSAIMKDAEECKRLITSNPNQNICLSSLNETDGDMDDECPF